MPQPARPKLYVCHPDDMFNVHPSTDWQHQCGRCKVKVGIYPSGQEYLRVHQDAEIVCNRCEMPSEIPIPDQPARRRHRPF